MPEHMLDVKPDASTAPVRRSDWLGRRDKWF